MCFCFSHDTDGGLYVLAKGIDNSLVYLPVDDDLQAGLATAVTLDVNRDAIDLAFLPNGGVMTILAPPSDLSDASEVLQMTALAPPATANPIIWEVDGLLGLNDARLKHAKMGSAEVILAGAAWVSEPIFSDQPVLVVQTHSDGSLGSCVPSREQDPQSWTLVDHQPLGSTSLSAPIQSQAIPVFYIGSAIVKENHHCQ